MLSLVEVSAGYDSLRALFGVSLEVAAGETVGVIGPNGAGKTTLMRVISGLVGAFAGAITLDGRSIVGAPAHRIVDRVIVLDHGEKIFEGAPAQAAVDPRVTEVYLGKGHA